MTTEPRKVHSPVRAILIGLFTVILGALVLATPLLLGNWEYNKYIATAGFLLSCLGLGFILNGAVDVLRAKR